MEEVKISLCNLVLKPVSLSYLAKLVSDLSYMLLQCYAWAYIHGCRLFRINHNTLNYSQEKIQVKEDITLKKNSGGIRKDWFQTFILIECCNNVTAMIKLLSNSTESGNYLWKWFSDALTYPLPTEYQCLSIVNKMIETYHSNNLDQWVWKN